MIKPLVGENAQGTILMELSAEDVDQLDRFEGENYRRTPTEVILEDGASFTTEMYVEIAGREEDGPFDLEGWLQSKREDFITGFMQGRGFDRPKD